MLSGRQLLYGLAIGIFSVILSGCDQLPEGQPATSAAITVAAATDTATPSFTPTLSTTSPPTNKIEDPADVIFHNGTILTMETGYPVVEAIAIRGDRILAVGSDEEVLVRVGPETQVIDLAGQTLLPGLTDGHTHILAFPGRMGKSLDEAQDVALRHGFTSVTEMWADEAFLQELIQAEEAGRLRLRVNVFPIYNDGILDENGNKVIVRAWYPENDPILDSDRMLRIPGIKVFVDGASTPGRGCPALSEPYETTVMSEDWFREICGSEHGDLYWSQEELNQVVADAQASGYRVAFHTMGDRAIETVLNSIEFSLDGQPNRQHHHQIQHNSLLRLDLLERYVSLDVLASVRGYFNTCDQDFYITAFGLDRYEWAANRYALPGSGVHAYLETDFGWTVDPDDIFSPRTVNPMVHLYGLVTHQQVHPDGTICLPDPWISQHAISVEQALRMMTYEPAFAVSQEDVLGTLEPGKFADLIVLSQNPITVDPNSLKDMEVWMTMVGGHVEYCASGHEALCPRMQPSASSLEEPTAEPTESPVEPVTIKLFKDEEQVAFGTPIQLTISWLCDTAEQVADFLAAASLSGTLDGQPLPDLNDYWGEIVPYEGGYGDQGDDYLSHWLYPLGVLSPGTHMVKFHASLNWPVTDGFDSNDDGLPDEYSGEVWHFSIRIIVEELVAREVPGIFFASDRGVGIDLTIGLHPSAQPLARALEDHQDLRRTGDPIKPSQAQSSWTSGWMDDWTDGAARFAIDGEGAGGWSSRRWFVPRRLNSKPLCGSFKRMMNTS